MDRNIVQLARRHCVTSRPPRGGRGSQLGFFRPILVKLTVAPREGGVDRNPCPVRGSRGVPSRPPRGGRGSQHPLPLEVPYPMPCRPPRGGRGSQRDCPDCQDGQGWSPPARGAWIATFVGSYMGRQGIVAPREGGVDRNYGTVPHAAVQQSRPPRGGRGSQRVASRPASGLRGRPPRGGRGSQRQEPGFREARRLSPPARGAWIATLHSGRAHKSVFVAPREGGVDRNNHLRASERPRRRRPPRGGRGSQRSARA